MLPCRNEEANVAAVVGEALEAGHRSARWLEVLVVDDASTDGTAACVTRLARSDERVRLVARRVSRGYGAALRTGLLRARGDWVFYTDGDGQFPLGQLPGFLERLAEADVVAGYRRVRRDAPGRRWLGRGWTWLANGMLGLSLRDVNCAFKVFPRLLFERVALRCDGAAIDAELMAAVRQLGLQVVQVPVEHRARRAGNPSGGRPSVALQAVRELWSLTMCPPGPSVEGSTAGGSL